MESKKLSCQAVLLCEKTSIDPKTKLISLTNIVQSVFIIVTPEERAQIGQKPKSIKMPLELVAIWQRTDKKEEEIHEIFRVQFADPQGKVIFDNLTAEVHMPSYAHKFYAIIKIDNLVYSLPGMHTFKIIQTDVPSGTSRIVHEENFEIIMRDAQGERITQ